MKIVHSTPQGPQPISDKLAVIFDRESGTIVHLHRVTTLAGATVRSDDQIAAAGLTHAERLAKIQRNRVDVIVVEPDALKAGHVHRVSTKERKLQSTPRKRPT